MNRSYIAALAIFVAVVLLFTVGTLLNGEADSRDAEQTETSHRFEVVVRSVEAQMRPANLSLRGRTEAFREVVVRAETGGRVAEAERLEGTPVTAGDVLCRLDVDARSASVQQAEADLRARQLEYDAAAELNQRGHRSANQVAAAEAARDAARARLSAAREELANVNIAAPFDGIFDGRTAEVGDFLRTGDACGTVVQLDPILVVAEVGERHVAELEPGMAGQARLVTGQTVEGTIRFVERRADPTTRTFRVELEAPNPDHAIRSGITAEIRLDLPEEPAHRIPASILALNADGVLGVRIVEDGNRVRFVPVELLSDDGEQVWVAGLPRRAEVIVLGQDFVADGVEVDVSREGAAR
ncbi:efflux RND transporter periplasmic adaptor subunit [Maricaulis sp.]|uniref:efflux RND transporter periplasmic adaptor subunit n=1 Tax=Maricaulis sp. TaxID=1486257 RepID=UPI001B1E577D|nr:efflux RND transporter periplasmic adaptor subunit [Maricaulis sp.]MBO6764676.1 efflux RND transporter periplasmic adaptor subunit [Maricaulis sp.]